jgi:hypothetical protein
MIGRFGRVASRASQAKNLLMADERCRWPAHSAVLDTMIPQTLKLCRFWPIDGADIGLTDLPIQSKPDQDA